MAEEPDYQNDESIFKWDEKSQLYFHASSGFYHDPNAGWYYSSRDGLYYKFEDGNYVLLDSQKVQGDECAIDEGGEVLPGNTIQDEQCTNSYCWNDEYYSSFQGDESEGMGTAADECTPGHTTCVSSHDAENPPPPSEWLEDTLIDLYLSGYSTTAINATDEVRMPLETDEGDNFKLSAHGNGDDHELEGECIPEDHHGVTDSIGNVVAEGDSWDEENWRAQYGQVIKSEDSIPNFPVVDLWDWAMVSGVKKDGKGQVARLVGRLVRQSTKLHPSMPSGGGLMKTAPICEVHLDLVRVTSGSIHPQHPFLPNAGQVYRLKSPSSRYLASLSIYDSSNPTKDWSFPKLSVDQNMLPLSKCQNSESKVTDGVAIQKDLSVLQDPKSASDKHKSHVYRDRAAERRTLHGGFGVGPGQKNLVVGDAMPSSPVSVSTEEAAAEALNMSFGAGSYARRILESMGWKEGEALGNTAKGLLEPLEAVANRGNAGLGWTHSRMKHN
ncbi:hypothetical protein CK203_072699 [Vitis vinifera]|uniref:G-patch domain-containing protein n=1 Tax=Vitis vinifera TaxID=29760 RepID=A0A438EYZ1_VITVI|nr:hypothetical protein CK203_072699 [Vitis vinifera]